jgi:hypothetical protein
VSLRSARRRVIEAKQTDENTAKQIDRNTVKKAQQNPSQQNPVEQNNGNPVEETDQNREHMSSAEKSVLFGTGLWIERFERVLTCEWDAYVSRMGRTTADTSTLGTWTSMHVIVAF